MILLFAVAYAQEGAPELGSPRSTSRMGVGFSYQDGAPRLGVHLGGTAPAGSLRTAVTVDARAWRHPTAQEEEAWSADGIQDLPEHWRSELTGTMSVRMTFGQQRLRPGWEAGIAAGRWAFATARVQDEYRELGADIASLEEWRFGPELQLGVWTVEDHARLSLVGRFWLPAWARLDGDGGRYEVGDRRFDPVETVNPWVDLGLGGYATLASPVFLGFEVLYRQPFPSAAQRDLGLAGPEGDVRVELSFGLAL